MRRKTRNDPVPRTGQAYAIVLHRRIWQFLDSDPSHKVEVSWCPGHKDIQGNEGAEKSADAMGRTRANARREAKAKTAAEWKKIWEASPKHGRYATANRFPPSLRPTQHFLDLAGKTEVYGRNIDCPCGELFRTREHVIRECPLYEMQRGILRNFIEKSGALLDQGRREAPAKPRKWRKKGKEWWEEENISEDEPG
ncbi:RnaseH domain, transposon factor [Desarmillaria ectypa]|nr:RnaseH domain, transposon factor [Desarmillaria ectypa]